MSAVWHGRDWEEYCISLLQKRYSAKNTHALQLVPARHQGDLGLEAFSHDGFGYQCYAAEEPLSGSSGSRVRERSLLAGSRW